VSSSIFWHDYETTGINPRCDRPLQVAGVRTDFDLNEIDEPISLYCRPRTISCRTRRPAW
jgi:exodeoxyribonuclease-1